MNQLYISLISQVLQTVINNASPEVLSSLRSELVSFQSRCYDTANPWDDVLAYALAPVVSVLPKSVS